MNTIHTILIYFAKSKIVYLSNSNDLNISICQLQNDFTIPSYPKNPHLFGAMIVIVLIRL